MPADQRRTVRLAIALVVVAALLGAWWWLGAGTGGELDRQVGGTPTTSRTAAAPATVRPTVPASTRSSGLSPVRLVDLPVEARRTLDLISAGGPFPYSRDGVVFQNREHRLPRRASGYYREYTVPTPGEHDRGARRIIVGRSGERYWTPDHYASFSVIVSTVEGGGQ